ncbi:PucR family transcriptional regulator [Cryptosporangium aurantiacum]|uniref:PucR C-terminal helix-turn-helix domain-containing protein n=1 Tax=Cryptosporangium aurantiacum TaxID=134849 RepID=A0A1M7RLC0_9ACTN|nr:helix-turn-helix domain-containing protein [Cryptosporangium aurantiacum]SHN46969.1 PucR C-terminal helix-turn-helix domain-containing protein [Cryptosporangium aurantiacum]
MVAAEAPDRTVVTVAARSLRARLPELTDRLVGEFAVREELVLADEVRKALCRLCTDGLRAAIAILEHPDGDRADLRLAAETGTLWAARGLPLDSLLRLYRLAGRLLWENLLQAAGPAGASTLVHQAGAVLRGIDQESTAAAAAYRQAERRLLPRGQLRVAAAIDALLSARPPDAAELETAADLLDLPAAGPYVVAVQRPGAQRSLVAGHGRTGHRGMRFCWRRGRDADRVLVLLGRAGPDELEEVLRPLTLHHVGIGLPVEGLAEVPKSHRYAELAVRSCRADGPEIARFDRRLPQALVLAQPELAEDLVHEVLGAVLVLPVRYREALLDTLEAWLGCDGSAVAASRALYCHRNTVLYRLRRLQELTGRSLSKPSDLVDLTLALHAFRAQPPSASHSSSSM